MRGLTQLRSTRVITAGHAFVQNIRRGHYELAVDADLRHRLPAAFAERACLALMQQRPIPGCRCIWCATTTPPTPTVFDSV